MRRLRSDEGSALLTVMLVSLLVGALGSLALNTGRQSEWSSTSDRNHEQSLGAAEAGVDQVITRVSAQLAGTDSSPPNFWTLTAGAGMPCGPVDGKPARSCAAASTDPLFSGTTPQGKYWYWVTRCSATTIKCPGSPHTVGFVVDVQSTTGGQTLGRKRHVQATLTPPSRFPGSAAYALFSYTSIEIQNNDQVLDGDVFANTNIVVRNSNEDPAIKGSLTSATGWIQLENGVHVTGNVWSGGYQASGIPWALKLGSGARVGGWAKASVTSPTDPTTCGAEIRSNYDVPMDSGSVIAGDLTTLGNKTGAGTVQGTTYSTCSAAHPTQNLPVFTLNDEHYDPTTYREFPSVAAFQGWLYCNGGLSDLRGTIVINEAAPAQTGTGTNCGNEGSYHRVDLTGAILTGSLTIVTNAPIYTGSLNDTNVTGSPALVLVSHYQPPTSSSCSTEQDTSNCAIHIKNNFALNEDGKCKTATLVYADKGPVAIKNGGTICGSVIADGILVKNLQTVTYDPRVDKIVGFGSAAYDVSRWQELPAE